MFRWLKSNHRAEADEALSVARDFLATTRIKFAREGDEVVLAYAEGAGQTAGLLAERFSVSVPAALVLRGIDPSKLKGVASDLLASAQRAKSHLNSPNQATRHIFHGLTFGTLLFYNFCTIVSLAQKGPAEVIPQALKLAEEYAAFARLLGEISVGVRHPTEAYAGIN